MEVSIRPISESDKDWVKEQFKNEWGSERIYSRGKLHDALTCDGFVATISNKSVGLITFVIENNEMEALSINTIESERRKGIGSQLFKHLIQHARQLKNIKRLWGITTNDNTDTIKFIQKLGFHLVALHREAITQARKTLKPEIPEIGSHGIPIRDEIEIEYPLSV